MAFERLRGRWERLTAPLLELFGWLRPNHLTWASLFAALAAASIAIRADRSSALPWLAVSALMSLAFILDGLDGQLARKRGLASAAGDLLDHTLDRVVDVALLVALGSNTSWFLHPELGAVLGWAAALTTMLGSYMGTAAQSVGLNATTVASAGGPLHRPHDRRPRCSDSISDPVARNLWSFALRRDASMEQCLSLFDALRDRRTRDLRASLQKKP